MLHLTKFRLRQERAKRELHVLEELTLKKRREYEKLWLEYLDEAERNGLCRFCLKPKNEGEHSGLDHMALGIG